MKSKLLISVLTILLLDSCAIQNKRCLPDNYFQSGGQSQPMRIQERHRKTGQILSPESHYYSRQAMPPVTESSRAPGNNFEIQKKSTAPVPNQRHIRPFKKSATIPKVGIGAITLRTIDPKTVVKQEGKRSGDGIIYLTSALMGLTAMGLIRSNRSRVTKVTRWAKANPKKTQWLIAGLHLPLLGLGVMSGHNLKELGYELSGNLAYVFGPLMCIGYLLAPFRPKRNIIAIPNQVDRQRLAYLGITLSSLMMMTGFGNTLVDKYPNTYLSYAVQKADQSIFPSITTKQAGVSEFETAKNIRNTRKIAAAASAGSVFAIIGLVILACAGICLVIGGGALIGSGEPGGVALIILGIGVFWLSIKGFQSVSGKNG